MRADPAMVAKAEAAVTNRLAELAPFIDKMEALEVRERADTLAGQDAAAARARGRAVGHDAMAGRIRWWHGAADRRPVWCGSDH